MRDNNFAIGEKLRSFIHEIYESCENPLKSEKCICYGDPGDIPCHCRHMLSIREHLRYINAAEPKSKPISGSDNKA